MTVSCGKPVPDCGRHAHALATCMQDVEAMSGSTVDAMADAIDHSHTVLYAVSLEYKESANCKLECMYAHSAGVEMIPMMLQDNFKANGWLGMMLGTRLWCVAVAMQPGPH